MKKNNKLFFIVILSVLLGGMFIGFIMGSVFTVNQGSKFINKINIENVIIDLNETELVKIAREEIEKENDVSVN